MLATFGVAKAGSMLPTAPAGLPGSAVAAANARAAGLPLGNVTGVAVAADGVVTVTVAGTVAMAAVASHARPGGAPVDEEPSSTTLGERLEAELAEKGLQRPPGTAAHHIVAGNAKLADPARRILRKFGIGINDVSNGVFLPCNSKTPCDAPGAFHSKIHTPSYYDAVNNALNRATTREAVINELCKIGEALQAGRYP